MSDYRIFGILILAILLAFIAIFQIIKQSLQQRRLLNCRARLNEELKVVTVNIQNVFFSKSTCMIENKSKLKQHNEGQSPYSIWWPSFQARDFSANCKMTTTERGLR